MPNNAILALFFMYRAKILWHFLVLSTWQPWESRCGKKIPSSSNSSFRRRRRRRHRRRSKTGRRRSRTTTKTRLKDFAFHKKRKMIAKIIYVQNYMFVTEFCDLQLIASEAGGGGLGGGGNLNESFSNSVRVLKTKEDAAREMQQEVSRLSFQNNKHCPLQKTYLVSRSTSSIPARPPLPLAIMTRGCWRDRRGRRWCSSAPTSRRSRHKSWRR